MIELVILIFAVTLLYVLMPVVFLYVVIKTLFRERPRTLKVWFWRTARAIDVFANVNAAELFNDIFIKRKGYKFGHPGETISSVLGKNQYDKTLTKLGNALRYMLDIMRPNHCLDSIKEDITNTKK